MNAPQSPLPTVKKPYKKPGIQVYGDLREITQHVNNTHVTIDPPPHVSNFRT